MLWPSRLAAPLDGAPLDGAFDALIIGLALPVLFVFHRAVLHRRSMRIVIVSLLAWKTLLVLLVVPDGWCVQFTSPRPLFVGQVTVPHAWDVRADWRNPQPQCSAIVTRPYDAIDAFPVWFYNLPPSNLQQPAAADERPPQVTLRMTARGSLYARAGGVLRIVSDTGVELTGRINNELFDGAALASGVALASGPHLVSLAATLTGDRWRFDPRWNDRSLWSGAVMATRESTALIDRLLRPWGAWVTPVLVGAMVLIALAGIRGRVHDARVGATTLIAALGSLGASMATPAARLYPALLGFAAVVRVPRTLQNLFGAQLLVGVPFLAMIAAAGVNDIGRVTWYSIGDDWWMFQRFAYRIYLQQYWLEGGEMAFWFQPFYRWIAGALHMVFGDSSVGELFWDGACVWAGALFAFHVTRVMVGFRWGIVACVITLAMFTLGPSWYLFGRGLSEITSAGFVYAAALLLLRGRRGARLPLIFAGLCIALAFYTRLNNLMFAATTAAFCLPVRQRAGDWLRARDWWPHASRRVLATVAVSAIVAITLLSLRAYHYTGTFNALSGTQASARSIWQTTDEGSTPMQNLVASVLLVTTMSDQPRFDVRALPIGGGLLCALLALAGVRRLRELPLNVTLLCVAGMAGALVAKGSAYPGRFSVHLIPVTVALFVCAVATWRKGARVASS